MHENITVLEVNDVAQMAELAVSPKIRRYLLARLSDTVALIDPGHTEALAKALLAEGHTPKMVKGMRPMSKKFHLENILSRQEKARLNLDLINADELKRIARFWFGPTLANKMRKAECLNAINSVFKDRARVEKGVRSLSDQERQILSVFKRYGGALSGPLLMCETLLRGLFDKTVERGTYYNRAQSKDPVEQLGEKLILITTDGRAYSGRGHYHYGYHRSFPDLVLQPIISDLIEPAKTMAWTPSASASAPMTTNRRSAAQIALDLRGIAQALAQSGSWKTNRGGSLAKSVQNRLKKVLPSGEHDPMMPPAGQHFFEAILNALGNKPPRLVFHDPL